jgi:hypothetical protein
VLWVTPMVETDVPGRWLCKFPGFIPLIFYIGLLYVGFTGIGRYVHERAVLQTSLACVLVYCW